MVRRMRPFVISFVLAAAFVLPVAAFATDAPPPAVVTACQAEAAQLGKDAFVAKYGPTEPFGHCYAAHTTTPVTTTTTTAPTPPKPAVGDAPKNLSQALCYAEAKANGTAAFAVKYGKEAFGQCVKATLAKAQQLVASCQASSGSSKDAYRACLAAAASRRR
jgi:hypothetical protein